MSSQPTSSTTEPKSSEPPVAVEPEFKYYRAPQSIAAPRELPDSYFTPTYADLKAAQASLTARTQALTNAPLRTQAMRDAEDKVKRARWPHTAVRVKFSDRSQLEKTFQSTDKIRSVYAFVRGSLREDVRPIKFVLYQTPPKREFKVSDPDVRNLSLAELQLAPSSVLLLRFEDDALNHVDVPAPLDPSILAQVEDLPIPPDFDSELPSETSSVKNSTAASSSAPSTSGKSEIKVPKWLKMGSKK
ncbi:hypothetical protein BKA93DRAFT_768555 [Sparassis latifolia]|uniref:UBX domain-containing protein n=1 Tax=Sparassis crispa TaxID=139825 RepID=A0A401H252_9APHY|nr:hypothetical protein SCP_1302550 [Sparassis crispa]GBE88440.1 hypothetical protein SCP_1302550 [Sparassis crispa]